MDSVTLPFRSCSSNGALVHYAGVNAELTAS